MGLFKRSMFLGMAAIAILEGFAQAENTLRGAFADKFLIGTALNVCQVESKDKALQALVRDQFSAVVAENCMKAEVCSLRKESLSSKMATVYAIWQRKMVKSLPGIA